jgi:hypothetical protein
MKRLSTSSLLYVATVALGITLLSTAAGCNGGSSQLTVSTPNGSVSTQKVINGVEVNQADAPQFVQIRIPVKDGEQICSGTVIGKDAVLSAAHCFSAMVGLPTVRAQGADLMSNRVITHPSFVANTDVNAFFFDLAVVRVPGLNLPALAIAALQKLEAGQPASVYGYGITEDGGSEKLVSGSVTVAEITPNHLISKFDGSGANPCFGDSGGPILQSFSAIDGSVMVGVIGVISSGSLESCNEGDQTLYTALSNEAAIGFLSANVPDLAVF